MTVEPFIMENDVLYKMGKDNRLRQYMSTTKAQNVMKGGTTRRHYVIKITQKKILDARY